MVYTHALLTLEMIKYHTSIVSCMITCTCTYKPLTADQVTCCMCIAKGCGLWHHHTNDKRICI